jgi:flagellin
MYDRLASGMQATTSSGVSALSAMSPAHVFASDIQMQVDGYDQSSRDLQSASTAAQVANNALSLVCSALLQMNNLALKASSMRGSPGAIKFIDGEIASLMGEIDVIAVTTQFNGVNLLDGSVANGLAVQMGPNPGATQTLTVPNVTTTALGISGLTVQHISFAPHIPDAQPSNYQTLIHAAITSVLNIQAAIGSSSIALDTTARRSSVAALNLQAVKTASQDLTVAISANAVQPAQFLQNVQLAVLAQANINHKNLIRLVRSERTSATKR